MKTLRDTNNNNSATTPQHFPSAPTRQNLITPNEMLHHDSSTSQYPSASGNQTRLHQQTIWRNNHDPSSINSNPQSVLFSSKRSAQSNSTRVNPYSLQSSLNPFASIYNGDTNQLSSMIQSYLSKLGANQLSSSDANNPSFYLQLMNANAMFMQQLSAVPNNTLSIHHDLSKHQQSSTMSDNQQTPSSNVDSPTEPMTLGRSSQILQPDCNVFVPKTRPMTQEEIAEHARLVYQRALQRNQLQQHTELMKHFYETLNVKQQNSSAMKSTDHSEVPGVPNVSNIASIGTFDVVDTMLTSPMSCLSIKELNVDATRSSVSLRSADDTKLASNTRSVLDPSAPIFIPRQSRLKLDDDNETSSSSSDSDFNDFHYLDQYLDEFYNSDNDDDNHLIVRKSSSSEGTNQKNAVHPNTLGQGDVIEETIEPSLATAIEKQECQYSIYELLNRYRNPRCHIVLPEWSRLSLILPNVCSMRDHTYKIKRYFAYRRRLSEDQNANKDLNISISAQG